ncbi:MAG: hypothetical protein AABZ64_11290 [Nitrospinota bacterium]
MILRLILYLLIFLGIYYAISGLLAGAKKRPGEGKGEDGVDDVMAPCPECGAYFPMGIGVSRRSGGQRLLFCSEECAERHARRG